MERFFFGSDSDLSQIRSAYPIRNLKYSHRVEKRTSHGSYILRDGTGTKLQRHFAPSQLKLVLDDFEDKITYEVEDAMSHIDRSPDKYFPSS